MKVAELSPTQLANALRSTGIGLRIGQFAVHVETPIRSLADTFALLYAAYPLGEPSGFADFHIRLVRPKNLRRWLRPQVSFLLDGHAPFNPLPLGQAFPLFEWGLNWCCANHLNQYLLLHAAVLEKTGSALILPGMPGSGKSTLCAGLLQRGWRLLSDELALVSVQNGSVTPLPRPVSLKNEAIEVLRRFAPTAVMGPAAVDTTKGVVAHMRAPPSSVARSKVTANPAWLVFPRYQAMTELVFRPYPRARAFMRAAENAFNYSRLGNIGFRTLGHLIDGCSCFELTYGDLPRAVAVLDALTQSSPCLAEHEST